VTLPRYVAFVSIGFSTLLALWIYPILLLILTPIVLALLLLIPSIVVKRCISLSSRIEDLENRFAHEISDSKYGFSEAQIYGYQDRLVEVLHGVEEEIYLAEKELMSTTRFLQFLTLLLIGTAITGVSLLMYRTQSTNSLPAVKISMAIFLPLVAFEGVTNWFPNLFVSGKLLRAQQSVDSLARSRKLENRPISKLPSAFDVHINSATVSWDKTFMNPVNASVEPGEILVLKGKSGSGKSTFALGLLGLLPYSGSIAIGGIQVREISTIYRLISASLQDGHIFNTSLRENLKIANSDVTDKEILRMLEILELNHISLDEILGEFGRPLSGGEAKRLGVARALLSKAPIVILDEPTEHLDAQLAERLETRISAECEDRALIVITHSGWAKCTRTVSITRE
jgi:ATP-binding cassette subfamily C protein CydC